MVNLSQMEGDDIVIAVLYNGTLVQNDSGDWEYRNGKNVMVSVGKRCTKSELEDCGIFTLKTIEFLHARLPLTFTQDNMEFFRKKYAYEVYNKELSI
ncbi:uncharacterized protein LOC132803871 isoform X2 [Ziziphus jujuba]|uniref:Uncharacterized protein LOC132803871 isoform X2 n=1 Tax=Ziziphus jujuba TaxID=326968 RepID=A0ABM4AA82_ZIZJJ|nr:uncharacterized protein LOC132803871 isoform X2 [Ziziphus jujuba]